MAEVSEGDEADIDEAVAVAARALEGWSGAHAVERSLVMARAARLLGEQLSRFVDVEVDQTGRPTREMAAQLARLPEWYDYFGALARTSEGAVPPFGGPYLNYTRRVALGVVGQITPWNHPLLILTKKLAPAIAAGKSVVVKPS